MITTKISERVQLKENIEKTDILFFQKTMELKNGDDWYAYFRFTESQSKPSTDPVILWLTGGPGCSGISALLTEIGPLIVNPDGRTLRFNEYGWNKKANILILESPAGVG